MYFARRFRKGGRWMNGWNVAYRYPRIHTGCDAIQRTLRRIIISVVATISSRRGGARAAARTNANVKRRFPRANTAVLYRSRSFYHEKGTFVRVRWDSRAVRSATLVSGGEVRPIAALSSRRYATNRSRCNVNLSRDIIGRWIARQNSRLSVSEDKDGLIERQK